MVKKKKAWSMHLEYWEELECMDNQSEFIRDAIMEKLQKVANKKAIFWKYCGNHPNGKDHERKDPHNFGLELISAVAYLGDGGDCFPPITYADTLKIKTAHSKGDDFGHEVTVSAPLEVWEKVKASLPEYRI